jgi:photosystem II stability/assembly factor-like uncharacterized protein
MKTKSTLFLLLLAISQLFAQNWEVKNAGFSNQYVSSKPDQFSITSDGYVWVVMNHLPTSAPQISRSLDGGDSWIARTITITGVVYVYDITAVSDTKVWISTNKGIYKTTNGGIAWTQQLAINPSQPIRGIRFFSDTYGIAVGGFDSITNAFVIYKTIDGGINWLRIPQTSLPVSTSGEIIEKIDATQDGASIWFSSFRGGVAKLYRSNDSGASWSYSTLPFDDITYPDLHDFIFSFKDANTGYVIGRVGTIRYRYKTVDGGVTFSLVSQSSNANTSWYNNAGLCYMPNTDTLFLYRFPGGSITSGPYFIQKSIDGGTTFTLSFTNKPFYNMKFIDAYANFGVYFGFGLTNMDVLPNNTALGLGGIYKYTTTDWTEKNLFFNNNQSGPVSGRFRFVNNSNIIWSFGTNNEFTISTDAGETWTKHNAIFDSNLKLSSYFPLSATTAFGLFSDINGEKINQGIFKTTDSGETWTKISTSEFASTSLDSFTFPNNIHFFDQNNGVAMGDFDQAGSLGGYYEIYTTSDGGITWLRVPLSNIPTTALDREWSYTGIYCASQNSTWFFGTGTDLTNSKIYYSHDKGNHWNFTELIDGSPNNTTVSLSFYDDYKGIISYTSLTNNKVLAITTNGGATFTPLVPNGLPSDFSDVANQSEKYYVQYIADNTILISNVGTPTLTTPYNSYISYDNGNNWSPILTSTIQQYSVNGVGTYYSTGVYEIQSNKAGITIGGTFSKVDGSGGILKFNSLLEVEENLNLKTDIKIYPNPVKTVLNLTIPDNKQIDKIIITDLIGNVVLEQTQNTSHVNIESLSNGIYIIQVFSGQEKFTNKFIKQ